MLNPQSLKDAKDIISNTTGGAKETFDVLREAGEIIIGIANFFKELFTNPMGLVEKGIDLIQSGAEPVVLIVLTVIIILKMLGFKEVEKYGWLTVAIYIIIMML